MKQYRAPIGHKPHLPKAIDPIGPLAGICAIILIGAMILLSTISLARVACGPAAHPGPASMLPASHPSTDELYLAAPSETSGAGAAACVEVDA